MTQNLKTQNGIGANRLAQEKRRGATSRAQKFTPRKIKKLFVSIEAVKLDSDSKSNLLINEFIYSMCELLTIRVRVLLTIHFR